MVESSDSEVLFRKGVLKICSKFTGVWIALQLYWYHTSAWVFSCNLLHIFKTSFPKNISEWLLLYGVTRLITCQVRYVVIKNILQNRSQPSITYSKLTIETLEQGVKCVQVTNKDTRTTSVASIWCLYLLTLNIFHTLF